MSLIYDVELKVNFPVLYQKFRRIFFAVWVLVRIGAWRGVGDVAGRGVAWRGAAPCPAAALNRRQAGHSGQSPGAAFSSP